mgnify:CR=1 FL=1
MKAKEEELTKKYSEIVEAVVRSHYPSTLLKKHLINEDDLMQFGYIGLIKGLRTYDKNKDTKLTTYLYQQVRYEVGKGFRLSSLRNNNKHEQKLINFVNSEDTKEKVNTVLQTEDTSYIILWDNLKKVHKHLPSIIEGSLKDKTHEEISKDIGINRSYISTLLKKHKKDILENIVIV